MKTLPPQLAAEIDEIQSWMFPLGSQLKIKALTGYSKGFISMVLNKKKAPTDKFMKAARKIMAENKALFEISQPLMKAS